MGSWQQIIAGRCLDTYKTNYVVEGGMLSFFASHLAFLRRGRTAAVPPPLELQQQDEIEVLVATDSVAPEVGQAAVATQPPATEEARHMQLPVAPCRWDVIGANCAKRMQPFACRIKSC